jgi:hypothetical protein
MAKIKLKTIKPMEGGVAQLMMRTSPECVKILDQTGELRLMNKNGMTLMEIDNFSMVEGQAWWTLWPESLKDTLIKAVSVAQRGMGAMFEAPCPTAKGTSKYWRVRVMAIKGGDLNGKIIASSMDITDEVNANQD